MGSVCRLELVLPNAWGILSGWDQLHNSWKRLRNHPPPARETPHRRIICCMIFITVQYCTWRLVQKSKFGPYLGEQSSSVSQN